MADVLSKEQRHRCMSAIHGNDTKPEMTVRSWLHGHGYRYRLHQSDLPGKPDIVLKKYRLAIFINGCYWHRHPGCKYATTPKTNPDFWKRKFEGNKQRDARNVNALESAGWNVLTIWECEIRSGQFDERFVAFINGHNISEK